MLRRLFAEGAFSQAFVPLMAQTHAESEPDRERVFLGSVATVLFWLLVLVTVIGVIGAPLLVWLIGGGLKATGGFDAAVWMTRVMFPYIALISLVAFASGILNTYKHFAIPAATPVLLNVSIIAAGWLLSKHVDPPIYALALGVVLGGVLQLAVQLPALAKFALVPRLSFKLRAAWRDEGARRVLKQMVPATLAVSVAQLSLVINTHIASRMQAGSTTWIGMADRLMEFPTALLGVALGAVLLPSLTRANTLGETQKFNELLNWGLRLVLLLALPCAVALAVFATPLVATLFSRQNHCKRCVAGRACTCCLRCWFTGNHCCQSARARLFCQRRHQDAHENCPGCSRVHASA
jgi:putative peptidoglycan lipid II flippase